MIIIDLIEVVLSILSELLLPEKIADKVKDTNTSKFTKNLLTILFTFIYGATTIGVAFSIVNITDIFYRIFATTLIIFLLYCLFVFYHRLIKHK